MLFNQALGVIYKIKISIGIMVAKAKSPLNISQDDTIWSARDNLKIES